MKGWKVAGTLKNVRMKRKVAKEAKMRIVVPSVLYGNETLEIKVGLRKRMDVLDGSYQRPTGY